MLTELGSKVSALVSVLMKLETRKMTATAMVPQKNMLIAYNERFSRVSRLYVDRAKGEVEGDLSWGKFPLELGISVWKR